MTNVWKHKPAVEFQYKISTIIAFGLFLQSLFIFYRLASTKKFKASIRFLISVLPSAVTSFFIWICLKQGIKVYCDKSFFFFFKYFFFQNQYLVYLPVTQQCYCIISHFHTF